MSAYERQMTALADHILAMLAEKVLSPAWMLTYASRIKLQNHIVYLQRTGQAD